MSVSAEAALTGLVSRDVNGHVLGRVGTLVAYSVDGLDFKSVERVGQQVADEGARLRQAHLPRHKIHVVVAVRAVRLPVGAAFLAHNVVDHIVATARLARGVPLQDHRRLVDDGDDVARCRGDTCGCKSEGEGTGKTKVLLDPHCIRLI